MLNEIEHILLQNFAGTLYYVNDKGKKAYKFITKNKYFIEQKKLKGRFYDFLDGIAFDDLPETAYKFQAEGVPVDTDIYKLHKLSESDKIKLEYYEKYFDNIILSVHDTKKFEEEEINDKVMSWECTEKEELVYFASEEYNLNLDSNLSKTDIINQLKEVHIISLRDVTSHGTKRLLEIFNLDEEQQLFDTTKNDITNLCKEKWLNALNRRKEYTYNVLRKEYEINNDEETKNEIESIKLEIQSKIDEFKNTSFSCPAEISSCWPIILYPKPSFSYITVSLKQVPVINNDNTDDI
jgi:hypothetical protein